MLLKSQLHQSQYSLMQAIRKMVLLIRMAPAGKVKVTGKRIGVKLTQRKRDQRCLSWILIGSFVLIISFFYVTSQVIFTWYKNNTSPVFVYSGEVRPVEGIPKSLSAGQVVWAPSASIGHLKCLVFVGWSTEYGSLKTSRKLGIKYCYNRPCALYLVQSPFRETIADKLPCKWAYSRLTCYSSINNVH